MSYSTVEQVSDNIYVNVVFNHDNINSIIPQAAEYKVTKTIPILDKCSDYYLSVIKFDLPLRDVPLYIFPVIPGSGLTNIAPMVIGIRTGGVNYSVQLIYKPDNNYIQPNQNDPNQQIITPYYFVYSYENLIKSINTALSSAYVSSGLSLLGHDYPYFYIDYKSQLINLVVDYRDFAPTATPTTPDPIPVATIYMNEYLQFYLTSFPYNYIGDNISGRAYEFNLVTYGDYNLQSAIGGFTINQKIFTQEYQTLNTWNALKKLLITTSSIPIISEYTPNNNSGSTSVGINNSGISATFPIISDFTPQLEFPGQTRSTAYYVPTSQYRLVDLKSDIQLNTIDLRVYWVDLYNNIYPLTLSIFQQGSIKLGFFKKILYRSNTLLLKK